MAIPYGDEYLNFTPEEAAEWFRGNAPHPQTPRAEPERHHAGAILALVVAAIFCIALFHSITQGNAATAPAVTVNAAPPHPGARNVKTASVRRSIVHTQGTPLNQTTVPHENPAIAFLPNGWTCGTISEPIPLADGYYGRQLGMMRIGTVVLVTSESKAFSAWRTVVSTDGSFWGYAYIGPIPDVPPCRPAISEWRNALELIGQINARRVAPFMPVQ